MRKPLVSVIIISYKNYLYIYEALDSVLSQTYPNIELIISNDGSSDFDKLAIEKYLKKHAKKNIKRIVVNNNKTNLGTVKNANIGLKLSKGKYILLFAADDAMYNSNIIAKFVESFESLPENELIATSQLGMYNQKLKKLKKYFVSESTKQKILCLSPKELFGEIALKCIIPSAGTCYKRKIFEKYGYFDEKYKLVEDYSSSLKYSRLGIKHNYFDFISFKHRHGGISHGNNNEISKTRKLFDKDIINIMDYEIIPYLKLLSENQKKEFQSIYRDRKWRFGYTYKYEHGTKKERRQFVRENWKTLLISLLQDCFRKIRTKAHFLIIIGSLLFLVYSQNFGEKISIIFSLQKNTQLINNLNFLIGFISIIIIGISIVLVTLSILFTSGKKIYKFLKFIL